MNIRSFLLAMAGAAAFAFASLSIATAQAQEVPDEFVQEILIKSTLMRFNDANLTGNYGVLWAMSATAFQDAYSPDDLAGIFAAFAEQQINIAGAVAMAPITTDAVITENGLLNLVGYFDTTGSQLLYELAFVPENGDWRMVGVDVNVQPIE